MSMSTHVVGFRPADKKWHQMKKIWQDCEAADVPIPKEVLEFFDHEDPADKPGAEVELKDALREWHGDGRSGYEVDIMKLPPDVKILRFYNAW
jgi:hypothetical protein